MKRFREGWATKAGSAGTAHFFRRDGAALARSLCGSQDAPAGWLVEAGSRPCCERCAKLRDKELEKHPLNPPEVAQDRREGVSEGERKADGPDRAG